MGIVGNHALPPNPRPAMARPQADLANKQPRQLLIALFLLLIALGVVLGKNRDFWFGVSEAVESETTDLESVSKTNSVPAQAVQTPIANLAAPQKHPARKASTPATATVRPNTVRPNNDSTASNSPVIAANRTVLPPLEVEVVAGEAHSIIHPGSNTAKVEIQGGANRSAAVVTSMDSLPSNAAEHESLRSVAVPELRQTVEATYPLLGQHSACRDRWYCKLWWALMALSKTFASS